MLPSSTGLLRDQLLPPRSVAAEIRRRMSSDRVQTVRRTQVPDCEAAGWVVDKRNKHSVRMRRPKPHDAAFVDRVWAAFAKLQFTSLNGGSSLLLRHGDRATETHEVDVFAADDEVILLVDCRSSDAPRSSQFKSTIDSIQHRRPGQLQYLKSEFPRHKVKFVLATNNFGVSQHTGDYLRQADIVHMDEDVIDYYIELADHLGRAARYQLLGSLFAGARIPNLDNTVVAVEARMGGRKYYSFSIEPERLLKLAYVLHRNKANTNLMPTYQRLIKKARLKGVAGFVEAGGYFPNSVLLSLDSGKRGLRFDAFGREVGTARAGVLHLPKTYRAAYVIDGQHRLYGYAESARAMTDLIPVVAFADLDRADQVRLFMQINENQQAVPKNLRNTLNADLLYDSPDRREQLKALKLFVAQRLGEDRSSPLHGRVLIGENKKTETRCISIDAISRGLERGGYLGSVSKTEIRERGSFYHGSNDDTVAPLCAFLYQALGCIRDGLGAQFALGAADGGFVFINIGIEALIRVLGDLVDHVSSVGRYDPRSAGHDRLLADGEPYIEALVSALASLDPAEGSEYRQMYGAGGATKYWRRLQAAINARRPEFDPPGLAAYLESAEKQFNAESWDMLQELEGFLRTDVRDRLKAEFGESWFKEGVPKRIQVDAGKLAVERNADRATEAEITAWDCLYLVDYQAILIQTDDIWKRLFEKRYTAPGYENRPGGRKGRTKWLGDLSELRNDVAHGRSISASGHEFLVNMTAWLIKGQVENDV